MTVRNVRVRLVVSCFFLASAVTARGEATHVDKAFVFSFTQKDISQVVTAIKSTYLGKPIEGVLDADTMNADDIGSIPFNQLQYKFSVTKLDVTNEDGAVRADMEISDFDAAIDVVYFNDAQTRWCAGIELSSRGNAIPLSLTLRPAMDGQGRLRLAVDQFDIGLNEGNMHFYGPDECHVIWGLNWLIRRLIPAVINRSQERIATALEDRIGSMMDTVNDQLDQMLATGIDLPVSNPNLPPFTAKLHIYPQDVAVTPDRARMMLGAGLEIEPKHLGFDDSWMEDANRLEKLQQNSLVGITTDFMNQAIQEAVAKNILEVTIDKEHNPTIGGLLTAAVVQGFIPDANTRFKDSDDLAIKILGLDGLTVSTPAGKAVGLNLAVKNLKMRFNIKGLDYVDLTLSGDLPLMLDVATDHRAFQLHLSDVTKIDVVAHGFAGSLSPAPAAGSDFDPQAFKDLVTLLNSVFSDPDTSFRVPVPALPLAGLALDVRSLGMTDGYVALELGLRPATSQIH